MGLRDLKIEKVYRSKNCNVALDFLVPVLSEGLVYKRAVGYFSSSALAETAVGIVCLAKKENAKIQLIASPFLSKEDVEAISKGYLSREEVAEGKILAAMEDWDSLDPLEADRLNLLANLIKDGILDIRIAFATSKTGMGMYHEKVAVVVDGNGDKVAFSGSMNDSHNAMFENYEAIDVWKSWYDPEERLPEKEEAFDRIWEGVESGLKTKDFSSVKDRIVKKYLRKLVDYSDILAREQETGPSHDMFILPNLDPHPEVPAKTTDGKPFRLRPYQEEAVSSWRKAGYRGIFDMATGTGKTITALAAIADLSKARSHHLACIIVCPYQHLVEQWVEDIEFFGMKPIVAYSSSAYRNWESVFDAAVRDQKHNVAGAEFLCVVCTNGTFATPKFQALMRKIKSERLLVVDEAHNFGADYLRTLLDESIEYRLALSATIERYRDAGGTDALFSYFGDRCIEYTLEEAIRGRGEEEPCLTPYRYYPIIVYLEDKELAEYGQLSAQIAKETRIRKNGSKYLTEKGKTLALKRARLVAAAKQKIPSLKTAIAEYVDDNFMLVYCGATKVEVDDGEITGVDEYETRQIDAVKKMLGNDLDMAVRQFTSREGRSEREEIKEEFSQGRLQALIAIKCLDEGVNIPMIKTAFILASTTNPREYVQRRGRLLRKDKFGRKERAEIYDFITLPRDPADAAVLPGEETRGEKRLVYNELVRAKEFASLAENRASVMSILDEIEESFFGINGISSYGGSEVE